MINLKVNKMKPKEFVAWIVGFVIDSGKTSLTHDEILEIQARLKSVLEADECLKLAYSDVYLAREERRGILEYILEPSISVCFWVNHWLEILPSVIHRNDVPEKSFETLAQSIRTQMER